MAEQTRIVLQSGRDVVVDDPVQTVVGVLRDRKATGFVSFRRVKGGDILVNTDHIDYVEGASEPAQPFVDAFVESPGE
jgi:hypothetical protein